MTWQPWAITWTPPALDKMRRVDKATARRLDKAMLRYAATGLGDVIPLKGRPGEWRLKLGDWRAIFTRYQGPKPEERQLVVLAIRPRGGAYQP